jgi:hypothetical protein
VIKDKLHLIKKKTANCPSNIRVSSFRLCVVA